jgi:hypothetical protein
MEGGGISFRKFFKSGNINSGTKQYLYWFRKGWRQVPVAFSALRRRDLLLDKKGPQG